jgi:hypothetical protein
MPPSPDAKPCRDHLFCVHQRCFFAHKNPAVGVSQAALYACEHHPEAFFQLLQAFHCAFPSRAIQARVLRRFADPATRDFVFRQKDEEFYVHRLVAMTLLRHLLVHTDRVDEEALADFADPDAPGLLEDNTQLFDLYTQLEDVTDAQREALGTDGVRTKPTLAPESAPGMESKISAPSPASGVVLECLVCYGDLDGKGWGMVHAGSVHGYYCEECKPTTTPETCHFCRQPVEGLVKIHLF